jgi:hypothetical protein
MIERSYYVFLVFILTLVYRSISASEEPIVWDQLLNNAYQADEEKNSKRAYHLFEQATALAERSQNADAYNQVCMGGVYNAPFLRKRLPSPWYVTGYLNPLYLQRDYQPETSVQHHFEDNILTMKFKLGRHLESLSKASIYALLDYQNDTNSKGGGSPKIYNDNYMSTGAGIDYRPLATTRVFAEQQISQSLLGKKSDTLEMHFRFGIEYYQHYGATSRCRFDPVWVLKPFGDINASAIYYGRYDGDVIAQATGRIGELLLDYRMTSLSAYLIGNVVADTKSFEPNLLNDYYYNNTLELGPGLEWKPNIKWPLSLRLEYRWGKYWKGVPRGYADNYTSLLFQGIVYFEQ